MLFDLNILCLVSNEHWGAGVNLSPSAHFLLHISNGIVQIK